MKVFILAGGYGTRISEESDLKPKPMIEIAGKPIIWHIMKQYSHFGFREFVILLGYKAYAVKEYFANYFLHNSDVTIETAKQKLLIHNTYSEDWRVTLVDTGLETMTGGRLRRAANYVNNEPFLLTYGDGVSNVDITKSIEFHRAHGKLMTLTAVQPEGRFGSIEFGASDRVNTFLEKPHGDGAWINGGFFVCQPGVLDYIENDETVFERGPMETLARIGELHSFKHHGFWKCMDTLRDKNQLNGLWDDGRAPWKVWT